MSLGWFYNYSNGKGEITMQNGTKRFNQIEEYICKLEGNKQEFAIIYYHDILNGVRICGVPVYYNDIVSKIKEIMYKI